MSVAAATPVSRSGPVTADRGGLLRSAAVLVLAGGSLWWVVPRVAATPWSGILAVLGALTAEQVSALLVLWAGGLLLHSWVLTGSLPGLTRRRALTLNLTGSAVSNLLPAGGAAGVATNLMMMRRWSVPTVVFTAYTLVSNTWDVGAKLLLPAAAVVVTLAAHQVLPPLLLTGAALSAAVLGLGLAAAWAAPRLGRTAFGRHVFGRQVLGRPVVGGRLGARLAVAAGPARDAWPLALRTARRNWPQLTAGMAAYVAAQAALLGACLSVAGVSAPAAVVAAAFAVERLATLIPITPAGTGLAEAGALSMLLALGVDPTGAAAGVLLYRLFTVVLEIPVGAAWLAGWSRWAGRGTAAE